MIRSEFAVHMLMKDGVAKAERIAEHFTALLDRLESECGSGGREMSIVRTKLEEACFFAKRAAAVQAFAVQAS